MRAFSILLALLALLLTLVSPSEAPAGTPGHLKWAHTVSFEPGVSLGVPAMAKNGTIYAGGRDGNLYALRPDGTMKWVYEAGSPITTNPAVYSSTNVNAPKQGRIYFGTEDGRVLCVGPSGNELWVFDAGTEIMTSPAVANDGTVYFGIEPSALLAIDVDGVEKWTSYTGNPGSIHDPVIGPDGTIYFTLTDKQYMFALNPDGSVKWAKSVLGGFSSGPALGADGTIYAGGALRLRAFWSGGNPKWDYLLGLDSSMFTEPTIGHEGSIYACFNGVTAVNPDGTWRWDFWYGGERPRVISSAPAVDSSGLVYFGAWDGYIYCAAPDGSFVWRYAVGGGPWISSPLIGHDGILYVTTTNAVFAIYTGAVGPFDSSWPMLRRGWARNARLDWLYSIRRWLDSMILHVQRLDTNHGIKVSLTRKLQQVQRLAARDDRVGALWQLRLFVRRVRIQQGRNIPEEQAQVLIQETRELIALLGGQDMCDWGSWRRGREAARKCRLLKAWLALQVKLAACRNN